MTNETSIRSDHVHAMLRFSSITIEILLASQNVLPEDSPTQILASLPPHCSDGGQPSNQQVGVLASAQLLHLLLALATKHGP